MHNTKVTEHDWGWQICSGDKEIAVIMRADKKDRIEYEEDGFYKTVRFKVELNSEIERVMYPLIFSIPMLGF